MPRYLFHVLASSAFRAYLGRVLNSTTINNLNSKVVDNFVVPLPSLNEQARIVAILDEFDALVNDITQGLPAEIEARRKQYEYYRDRLLTFKEKAS